MLSDLHKTVARLASTALGRNYIFLNKQALSSLLVVRLTFETWKRNTEANKEERRNKHVAKTLFHQTLLSKVSKTADFQQEDSFKFSPWNILQEDSTNVGYNFLKLKHFLLPVQMDISDPSLVWLRNLLLCRKSKTTFWVQAVRIVLWIPWLQDPLISSGSFMLTL